MAPRPCPAQAGRPSSQGRNNHPPTTSGVLLFHVVAELLGHKDLLRHLDLIQYVLFLWPRHSPKSFRGADVLRDTCSPEPSEASLVIIFKTETKPSGVCTGWVWLSRPQQSAAGAAGQACRVTWRIPQLPAFVSALRCAHEFPGAPAWKLFLQGEILWNALQVQALAVPPGSVRTEGTRCVCL